MARFVGAGLALCLLGACATTDPAVSGFDTPDVVLDDSGLLAGGTGLEVGFGRAPDGAIAAVSALVGTAPTTPLRADPTCGPEVEVISYPGGLTLTFAERMFTGWHLDGTGVAYRTSAGVSLGDPADVLPADSGIAARTGPDGRIVSLSAGAPCIA